MTETTPHDCPHCRTVKSGFTVIANDKFVVKGGFEDSAKFLRCQVCGGYAVMVESISRGRSPKLHFYPKPLSPAAPEHLPDNVESFFLQGARNTSANPDAAGAMFRKALDVGLSNRFPKITGNLNARIKKSVTAGDITVELGEWAHHIRLEGNDAAHEDDPFTKEEAESLQWFANLLLTYLFTLPGEVKLKRRESETQSSENGST